MYDKDLMPVVDDLYLNDQATNVLAMKQEGRHDKLNQLFESFASETENSLFDCMLTSSVKQ